MAKTQPAKRRARQTPRPTFLSPDEMHERAMEIAHRILRWENHTPPLAYTDVLPVTDPISEAREDLAPIEVDEDRFEAEPPRLRTKVALWRLTAEVTTEHQIERDALLAWRNRTEALHKGPPIIDAERAKEIACEVVGTPPPNAVGPSVHETGDTDDETVFEASWVHFVPENVLVDGDLVLVRVNAATARPYTLFQKWRTVPEEDPGEGGGEGAAPEGAPGPA